MILVVVRHPVRPEHADTWPSLMEEFTVATRAEPGNICFDWFRSADDPNEWLLVEAFEDGEAGKVHVESPHFQKAIGALPRLLAAQPEIVNVEVPGGWARMSEMQVE